MATMFDARPVTSWHPSQRQAPNLANAFSPSISRKGSGRVMDVKKRRGRSGASRGY